MCLAYNIDPGKYMLYMFNLDCRRVSTVPRIKRWYSMFGKCGEDF